MAQPHDDQVGHRNYLPSRRVVTIGEFADARDTGSHGFEGASLEVHQVFAVGRCALRENHDGVVAQPIVFNFDLSFRYLVDNRILLCCVFSVYKDTLDGFCHGANEGLLAD